MNGRIYDPTLGRFLQADPHIQAPKNSQSYNRYSYVLNNPMNYTDPSGYFFKKLWKKVKQYASVIVGAALVYFTGGAASWFVSSWYGAATAGAIAGAAGAAANGGNIFTGALRGAFSAAAFYGVGSAFGEVAAGSAAHIGKTLAHGVVGGITSVLNGGKFGHGFAAAGATQAFAPSIDSINKGSRYSVARVTVAAVVGGTASKLTGGKFANGAVTGGFSRLFNDEMHHDSVKQRVLKAGNNALGAIKGKSEELYDYAKGALGEAADYITEKIRSGLSVKFDAEVTGGALGLGGSTGVTLAYTKYNMGLYYTVSGGGYAGLGVGNNYSVGTFTGGLESLKGFSGSVGGHGLMFKGTMTFSNGGVGANSRSFGAGANFLGGAFGFVNYTWELSRTYY
jgi:hypothetical protein